MAGLSGHQAIIDVVAAAQELAEQKNSAAQRTRDEAEGVPCALGHLNHPDARFCADCGLPMGAALPSSGQPMARPRPEAELTPAERAERERQHQQAQAAAAAFERQEQTYVPAEGEAVLIHFVADGLTAFGQVWYRGQELEIGPSHPRWNEALGWITLSRYQQVERWGEQKFDFGPWPGRRSYTEALGAHERLFTKRGSDGKPTGYFAGPSEEELRAADAAEARRGRGVPAAAFR